MVASYLDVPWKFLLTSIFHSIRIFFHTHNHAWAAYIHVWVILLSKTHNGGTKNVTSTHNKAVGTGQASQAMA